MDHLNMHMCKIMKCTDLNDRGGYYPWPAVSNGQQRPVGLASGDAGIQMVFPPLRTIS